MRKIWSFIYRKEKKLNSQTHKLFNLPLIVCSDNNTHLLYSILGVHIKIRKLPDYNSQIKNLTNLLDVKLSKLEKKLNCQQLHSIIFPKYHNIFMNQDVAVVGAGPTLQNYLPLDNTIHIGVNRTFLYNKIKFDFLFVQDYGAAKHYLDDFVKYDCHKFLGISSNDKICIPEYFYNLPNIEGYYTQYPFSGFFTDISQNPLGDYASIIFPALNFALYTHPRRIYLVGCDCNLNGYFNNEKMQMPDNILKSCLSHNKRGWNDFKQFVQYHYPDIEVISVNPVGLKGMFHDMYTKSYLREHPEINTKEVEILEDL